MTPTTTVEIGHVPSTPERRILVDTDYRLKDQVKAVPGARWDTDSRVWHAPLAWGSCLALRSNFGAGLSIGENLRDWAANERAMVERVADLNARALTLTPDELAIPDGLPGFEGLYSYQLGMGAIIRLTGRYGDFDGTGTGKTRAALAGLALRHLDGKQVLPCLVVAPLSMLHPWAEEIERFFPEADIRVVTGTPTRQKKAIAEGGDFYIMTWSSLKKWSRVAPWPTKALTDEQKMAKELQSLGIKAVIADEAHRGKNAEAIQTRALWSAAASFAETADATTRIALTGTPQESNQLDAWAILRFINPVQYPTKTSYIDRWLIESYNDWGGREIDGLNPLTEAEYRTVFAYNARAITKEQANPFLPPKVYAKRWVTMPPKQRKAYEAMKKTFVADIEKGTLVAGNALVAAGRLTQLANSMGEMVDTGELDEYGQTIYDFTMTGPSPKVDAFFDDVKAGDYDGSSVVVFSDSRQLLRLTEEAFAKADIDYVRITGDESADQREEAKRAFQAGEVQYMLLTRAGGEGITLTTAPVMVRLFRSWSLIVHTQVEDRVHRIGSEIHDKITYVDYLVEDSVELKQFVRLAEKKEDADDLTMFDLKELVA